MEALGVQVYPTYLIRFCLALFSGCLYDFQYSTLSTFASEHFGISGHNMSKEPPGYSQNLMNKEVFWTRQKYPNVSRHMFGAIDHTLYSNVP